MMKWYVPIIALLVVCGSVSAETDPHALKAIRDIQEGNSGRHEIRTLYVRGERTSVFDGAVDVEGALSANGVTATGTITAVDINASGVITGASAEVNGDVVLANNETIDNASDGNVRVTFDDDSTTLGQLSIESDNTEISNSDQFNILVTTFNSVSSRVDYASIDINIDDEGDASEDGSIDFNVQQAGTGLVQVLGLSSDLATFSAPINGESLDLTGTTMLRGVLTASNNVTLGSPNNWRDIVVDGTFIQEETSITVTGASGTELNGLGGVFLISEDGDVDTSAVTVANPTDAKIGHAIDIINVSTAVITLADSGNLNLSGALSLGQYDSARLVYAVTNVWVEISTSDNSP